MPQAWLTRTLRFAAAHRYYRPDWDETRNRAVFGPCANPHGHGHNYRLAVTVQGEVDAITGFVVDLAELDRILQQQVLAPLDHQHLNHAVPEFAEGMRIPSCENLLLWLWPRIAGALPPHARLDRLVLHEDENLAAELRGP